MDMKEANYTWIFFLSNSIKVMERKWMFQEQNCNVLLMCNSVVNLNEGDAVVVLPLSSYFEVYLFQIIE